MLQPAFQQVALVEVEATEAGIREIGSSGLRLLAMITTYSLKKP